MPGTGSLNRSCGTPSPDALRTAYEGQLELKAHGYVSDTQTAETLAKRETAKADLVRAELDLEYMTIRAPFAGAIQERPVEIGVYVRAGDPVLTFVDNTRLIVTASVAEQEAKCVATGAEALAKLVTGSRCAGAFATWRRSPTSSTRTFTVDVGQSTVLYTENFDSATAPALPTGWAMVRTGGTTTTTAWATATGTVHPTGGGWKPARTCKSAGFF